MTKKHIYFIFLILLCCIILLWLSSSSRQVERVEDVDAVEIFQKQQDAMNAINSCRTNVYLAMDFESGSTGADMSVIANMISSADINNQQLSSVIATTVVMNKTKKETEITILAKGSDVYMKQGKINDDDIPWEVQQLDTADTEALWEEQRRQMTGLDYTGFILPENFVYTGEEKSGGSLCYVFSQPINVEDMLVADADFNNQLESIGGFMPEDFEDMMKSGQVTCLIDKETLYLREVRLDTLLGYMVSGEEVLGTLKQYCRYDDYNELISIEIPVD